MLLVYNQLAVRQMRDPIPRQTLGCRAPFKPAIDTVSGSMAGADKTIFLFNHNTFQVCADSRHRIDAFLIGEDIHVLVCKVFCCSRWIFRLGAERVCSRGDKCLLEDLCKRYERSEQRDEFDELHCAAGPDADIGRQGCRTGCCGTECYALVRLREGKERTGRPWSQRDFRNKQVRPEQLHSNSLQLKFFAL